MMSKKVAKLRIERDGEYLYYVKRGDVWRIPRRAPTLGKRIGTRLETGVETEEGFIYFLDRAGDVTHVKRPT